MNKYITELFTYQISHLLEQKKPFGILPNFAQFLLLRPETPAPRRVRLETIVLAFQISLSKAQGVLITAAGLQTKQPLVDRKM